MFVGGELSNSATYFSSFANVKQNEANDIRKTFGFSETHKWKPWDYNKRVDDAAKVADMKTQLSKSKSSEATKRHQLTSYISTVLKSRQEELPLVSNYINCAKCEPLHLKNNCIKEVFMKLFKICASQTDFNNAKSFSDIPGNSLFVKFVTHVHDKMYCNFLSKKIRKWYNENSGKTEKGFSFRFRGIESLIYETFCIID